MDAKRIISDVRAKILSTGSPKTADTYGAGLKLFCAYFDKRYTHPKHIPTKEIVEFLTWVRGNDDKLTTEKKHGDSMARTCYWAVRYLFVEIEKQKHKFDDLKPIRVKAKPRMPLDKEFILEKIHAIENKRDKAIIATLFLTGIRRQACTTLKITDIDWANDVIRVTEKGNKQRLIPMTELLREILTDYIIYFRPLLYLFPGEKKEHHISPSTILKKVRHYLGTCTHITRYSGANALRKAGADLIDIRDWLGHASVKTTEIYLKNDIDRMKKVCKSLDVAA